MITIKNVSKSYNQKDKVVNNLNLEIKDGEIFGFLGPNGAGKSTTIKMITGILDIDEGEILIDDVNIKDYGFSINKKVKIYTISDKLLPDFIAQLEDMDGNIYIKYNFDTQIEKHNSLLKFNNFILFMIFFIN